MAFIVAIDGPAGTGKGTITKLVAKDFGLINIDTGATYRCVTLEMLNQNISIHETEKIIKISENINMKIENNNGFQTIFLNEEDVTEKIRSKEVTELVSQVSSIVEVRLNMVKLQRKLAEGKDVIMEGRDITTYVFPNANVKIYLDADVEERAKRRYKENLEKGINMTYEEVLEHIKWRDNNDKNKELGALRIAEDAIVIDTTKLSIEEVKQKVEEIIKKLKEKLNVKKNNSFLVYIFNVIVFRVKCVGQENIQNKGAYIICANHTSNWDAPILVSNLKRKVYVMAKAELFKNKFIKWFGDKCCVFPVKEE